MGIKFLCPNCGHKLNVKSFLAGKRGICPHCAGRFRIPREESSEAQTSLESAIGATAGVSEQSSSATAVAPAPSQLAPSQLAPSQLTESPFGTTQPAGPFGQDQVPVAQPRVSPGDSAVRASESGVPIAVPTPSPTPASAVDALADSPHAVWYVRPPSGGQFGPANAEVMRKWLSEGRVGPDSLVWREGWSEWQPAADTFPQLRQLTPPHPAPETNNAVGTASAPSSAPIPGPSAARPYPRRKSSNGVFVTVILLGLVSIGLLVTLVAILN